jgi:hypothetical protein
VVFETSQRSCSELAKPDDSPLPRTGDFSFDWLLVELASIWSQLMYWPPLTCTVVFYSPLHPVLEPSNDISYPPRRVVYGRIAFGVSSDIVA